jgi:hypothetical protein
MAKPVVRPTSIGDAAQPPESHMRVRAPAERPIDALYARFERGEITMDEAFEAMKALSLETAKAELSTEDYEALEESIQGMVRP